MIKVVFSDVVGMIVNKAAHLFPLLQSDVQHHELRVPLRIIVRRYRPTCRFEEVHISLRRSTDKDDEIMELTKRSELIPLSYGINVVFRASEFVVSKLSDLE